MNETDRQYLDVLGELLTSDQHVEGRNGGVTTHFGTQLVFEDVGNQFPLLTTKKVHFKSILVELLWFIKGDTNIKYLHDHGVKIWDEWTNENGDLGPVYGRQWRNWNGIDQLTNVINSIITSPYSRRHIVSAWNPTEVDEMALPPCHTLFQFHVRASGELDVQLYQRSADWFLGVPFNIASYALLLILIAREVGRTPGKLVHTFGNYHLYDNHLVQAKIQLHKSGYEKLPYIYINDDNEKSIFELEPKNILLMDYNSNDPIKAEVSK